MHRVQENKNKQIQEREAVKEKERKKWQQEMEEIIPIKNTSKSQSKSITFYPEKEKFFKAMEEKHERAKQKI